MSILIFGKLFAGGAALVGATLVMYHASNRLLDVDVSVYGFTAAAGAGESPSDPLKQGDNDRNFKCKLSTKTDSPAFDCYIDVVTWATNKAIIAHEYAQPDKDKTAKSEITNADIKAKDKVFKITAKKSQLKGWDASSTKIEILHLHDGLVSKETKNKYADITGLFSEEKNKFLGKTQYFVGKAKSTTKTLSKTANTCAWTDESFPSSNKDLNYVNCVVNVFGNKSSTPNSLDAWAFTKKSETTSDTAIEKDKYYLIAFTATQDIIEKGTKTVIFAKTSDADTQLVEFTEIHSAYLVENKNLLILG